MSAPTFTTENLIQAAASLLDPRGDRNHEYERGMAELIVGVTPGMTFDDVDPLIEQIRFHAQDDIPL